MIRHGPEHWLKTGKPFRCLSVTICHSYRMSVWVLMDGFEIYEHEHAAYRH